MGVVVVVAGGGGTGTDGDADDDEIWGLLLSLLPKLLLLVFEFGPSS